MDWSCNIFCYPSVTSVLVIKFHRTFYDICCRKHPAVRSTLRGNLFGVGRICFKLTVAALVRYLNWAFVYLDVYMSAIGLMSRVFANGPGDLGSIPGRVIPKTQKMILNAALLNNQHYKVRIEDKDEQSKKGSSAHPYTSV